MPAKKPLSRKEVIAVAKASQEAAIHADQSADSSSIPFDEPQSMSGKGRRWQLHAPSNSSNVPLPFGFIAGNFNTAVCGSVVLHFSILSAHLDLVVG
jgi:hypothetical protein